MYNFLLENFYDNNIKISCKIYKLYETINTIMLFPFSISFNENYFSSTSCVLHSSFFASVITLMLFFKFNVSSDCNCIKWAICVLLLKIKSLFQIHEYFKITIRSTAIILSNVYVIT